ncbi:S8 family serine peptidase [Aquimarina sp. I32.4]|uniref:S8 family serine peptidase n=1 Tax=Aquimarina sp. I32.4 TaxID=2053903 RepID=UPI000CDE909C|nr:S8 family serine peptidase [Aquimarina sp. I32.4]
MLSTNKFYLLSLTIYLLLVGCSKVKVVHYRQPSIIILDSVSTPISGKVLKNWYQKDIIKDTIPGISLEKVYTELSFSDSKNIIIAVIDTEIDINHEDLKDQIWINNKEIPNNNIDDDSNGYIDDINGWNFIGGKNGNIIYSNYEVVRIIREYQDKFEGKKENEITSSDKEDFSLYQKAKNVYDEQLKLAKEDQEHGNFLFENYPKSKALLKTFFPLENYNLSQVDSLYNVYEHDKELKKLIYFMSDFLEYELSEEWINDYKKHADLKVSKTLNLDFNDREILGDNPKDLNDENYGNGNVSGNLDEFYHGTVVAGVIGATRNNNIGIDGISNNLKIMSLNISSNGEEHDKDISLAIKYAVDNGAKIINMSLAKNFSLHQEWVQEAIHYASEKDVLIIHAASNENTDIDKTLVYPNDIDSKGNEFVDNFITVGSISNKLSKDFRSYFSNYGKTNVDIFAPGDEIFTTEIKNSYGFHSGTSMATAIVTGISSLLRSNYPDLSASQIKEILMKSGTLYNFNVEINQKDESKKIIPFSELSKSGSVVNAYNALLMAEQVSDNN